MYWLNSLQWYPAAKPFRNKGFPHFNAIEPMIPRVSKGQARFSGGGSKIAAKSSRHPPDSSDPNTPPPSNIQSSSSAPAHSSMSPNAPFSFLGPSATPSDAGSVLTSISRGKRKISSIAATDADSETGSRKRSRPLSAAVRAQQDGSDAMGKIATLFADFMQSYINTNEQTLAISDPLAHAIKLLEMHKTLTESNKLDVASFFSLPENEKQVVIFINFAESTRQAWLEKMFPGIGSNRDWVLMDVA
jgi:hypothetical protein